MLSTLDTQNHYLKTPARTWVSRESGLGIVPAASANHCSEEQPDCYLPSEAGKRYSSPAGARRQNRCRLLDHQDKYL